MHVYALAALLVRRDVSVRRLVPLFAAGIGSLVLAAPWLFFVVEILRDENTVVSWPRPLTLAHPAHQLGDPVQILRHALPLTLRRFVSLSCKRCASTARAVTSNASVVRS